MQSSQPEESLGAGLERQLDRFQDVQQQMNNFASDLSRLKTSCDALKQQRTSLLTECAERENDRAGLVAEVERIKAERDALQVEFAGMVEEEQFWQAADADANATMELEASGRIARRLWVESEKVKALQNKLDQMESTHEQALEDERSVASSLRERIGRLERKLREKSAAPSPEGSEEAESPLKHEVAVLQEEISRLKGENMDVRESLAEERKLHAAAQKRIDSLQDCLQVAQEEGRHYKRLATSESDVELQKVKEELERARAIISERDRLKGELQEMTAERDKLKAGRQALSPRALQPMSPNVSVMTPRTPTKTPALPSSFDSPGRPASTTGTPSTSLAKKYAYLEDRHAALKAAFDKMRSRYTSDIQHWKEYRAIQMARKELKQRRSDGSARSHAVGRSENGNAVASSSTSDIDARQKEPEKLSETGQVDQAPDPQSSESRSRSTTPTPAQPKQQAPVVDSPAQAQVPSTRTVSAPAATRARPVHLTATKATSTPARSEPTRRLETSTSMAFLAQTPDTSTPSELKGIARQPSRVTPWLGTGSRSMARKTSTSERIRIQRNSFSDFSDEEEEVVIMQSTSRTPLIRDRTGTATSLLRTALQQSATHISDDSVHLKSSAQPQTPETDSRKRKLDLEGLSPAERAAERRKLSRLSTAERREVYAPFKGKGRYIPPEDVQRTAADEYEIDPSRNGGVGHQFHEVVRNRDERKKMHGGDCECCRDYYEAIGPLPRFNQAPAWNSSASPEKDERQNLVDHQNRISRHREVWRKPPTPPDFWKIGFPTTQDVARVNGVADEMVKKRDAEIRREAAHKDSKWRKKV